MKLLIENWRQYLNESDRVATDYEKTVSDIQEFLSGGHIKHRVDWVRVRDEQGEVIGMHPDIELLLIQAGNRFARNQPQIMKALSELNKGLEELKDQELKNKLVNSMMSPGGSWLQVLEILKTL